MRRVTPYGLFIGAFLLIYTVLSFLPFWVVIINSFAAERSIVNDGFRVFPKVLSTEAYRFMFEGYQVFTSYRNTIFVTTVGTALATFVTATYAYVLSHRKARYRNLLSFLTYFAMLLGAGLVGFYILVSRWLGLKDNIFALILPYLLNPFYTFILVAAYRQVPYEIYESATIDGGNDLLIFFRIIWPISAPGIATVGLFYALQYWNDWWLALLFIDGYNLHPLQMMIKALMSNMNAAAYMGGRVTGVMPTPSNSIKMAVVCVTIGPIILVYPFVQRYFVKGITIGAVKG